MFKKLYPIIVITSFAIFAQPKESLNSSEIKLALKKLNTLGSVLYIAAHPDDENTEFLSFCNYGKLLRTGYLSLTRGDGGQNLIGDEQGDLLGVLRTQELLQARNIDGAEQFFTRAIDFGYSLTAEETFEKWGKEDVLSDVVWIIRRFKPDIIVTRFPATGEGRHGQHTASALLALEAFRISKDPDVFPEQLKYVEPWQPERIFWNAWTPALRSMGIESDTLIKINLGEYCYLLGRSYTEISAESRTMHKSQGFGDSGSRENYYNYFLQMDGTTATDDMFEGLDFSWNRVTGSDKVAKLLYEAEKKFDFEEPSTIIPLLLEAYKELKKLQDKYWVDVKSKELLHVIKSCAGIWTEAVTDEYYLSKGSSYKVETGIVNRSTEPFVLKNIEVSYQLEDSLLDSPLLTGEMINVKKVCSIPVNANYTHPYWLDGNRQMEMYNVSDQNLIGLPKSKAALYAYFTLEHNEEEIVFSEPVYYRRNDPVEGEFYRNVEIVPPLVANFNKELYISVNGKDSRVSVTIKSFNDTIEGRISLTVNNDWMVVPDYFDFSFGSKNEEQQFDFIVRANSSSNFSQLKSEIFINDLTLNRSIISIEYPHIQTQTVIPVAESKMVKIDLKDKRVKEIGYIMGSGDKIPTILADLGFNVRIFNNGEFPKESLEIFDIIVIGIRAYNTNEKLRRNHRLLMDYVFNGGTLLVQYNTFSELPDELGPYAITISRDRVTEEDSEVKILNFEHQLMNFPNKITGDDFNGWVQERGLYFPGKWAPEYETFLEMSDKNRVPLEGSLLFCNYGKGSYVYTGLSFFRQLPAGVIGAYNLFINLIHAGKK